MLQAITFDFWGTLYQGTFARDERLHLLNKALMQHNQPRLWTDLEAAYRHAGSIWERIWREEHRSITFEHWVHEVLAFLKADLSEDAIANLQKPIEEVYLNGDEPRPIHGVEKLLPRLAQRYRLGLISDTGMTPGRVLRQVLQRDGLLQYFQALTFSDETGTTKPLPEQFLRTLDILNTKPEKAAHIGDLPETDIAGAKGVGMKAILFLGVNDRQDGRSLADAALEEYNQLEKVLERFE
ncbi:MAG: HAD family hydrolase [Chloroflexi bacterium]|nr:HAD family hydrolase [Chloroflexota bacterium]